MKTIKFLSMAALAMVGTMTVGCSSDDNFIEQTQQPVNSNNVVTQTVTVGFDNATTRALAIDYTNKKLTKTFEAGDQIAVVYQNTSDELVKATVTIAAGDISTDGKSAKFTVTMTNPKDGGTLKYIYPAAMAGETDVDYTKLASQDGTLASLAANLDLATFEGTLSGTELPASASLTNKLAILALKIKNSAGTDDLTSTITGMTLSDGTNSYSITGKDTDGHIYAAIQTTSGANISCFATTSSGNYAKSLTGKTYDANTIYDLGLKMEQPTDIALSGVTVATTIQNGQTVSGTLGSNVKISIADGAIVLLKDANINGGGTWTSGDYAGITCDGDATIILEGTNSVKGFYEDYPGIFAAVGKTLTIKGPGTLNVSSNGTGAAGIGGGDGDACGNIVISGGTITATGGQFAAGIGSGQSVDDNASCGNITISGGTITATGGEGAAGIGSGQGNTTPGVNRPSTCGAITITSGVTKVTATKGSGATNSIGSGYKSTCGTVTIDGTEYWDGSAYKNGGDTYLATSPLVYPAS